MANSKEIKIRWISDESDIDRSITRMKQKLTEMNKSSAQMQSISEGGGTLSKRSQYAQKAFERTSSQLLQRESRELEQRQRTENLALLQKQRELNKLEKSEGRITAEKEKQVQLLRQEINLRAQRVMDIEVTKQDIGKKIEGIQGGGPTPPASPTDPKAMGMFTQLLKSIGVASVINGALNFTQHRLERDRKLLTDQGLTAQIASREVREQIQGQGARGLFFASERQKAMQMAAQEQKGMGILDFAKVAGGTIAGATGGALAGSVIPGVGTLAGGIAGGVSAFGGMMGKSDKLYNRMFDQDAYKQMMTREGMQKYEANRQMIELQDPLKTIAFETMQRDMNKNIGLERGLGLRGRELYGEAAQDFNIPTDIESMLGQEPFSAATAGRGAAGRRGFLERAMTPYGTGVGFERADVEGSVQSLIGAGATTEGARGMAGQALQFQRNLRLQNAPQMMGQMSGAGMEVNQTEQATIKLMSEAVKLGVDASRMPQEMQRMTAITAELATRGGGFNAGAAAQFGAGVTELTTTGLQGAKGAFDEMLSRAKEAGGFEGQMGMGFMMGEGAEGAFGKKGAAALKGDSKLMNTLNQLSADDLAKDPALAKGLAEQMGITPEELIEGIKKKDEFKQTRTGSQQAATAELGEAIKGMSPQQITEFIEGKGAGLYSKVAQEDIAARGTAESGKGRGARRASIVGRANRLAGNVGEAGGDIQAQLQQQLTTDEGLTPTEIQKGARATGDIAKLDALNKHLDGLTNAAKKHTTSAELYNQHFDRFVNYAKESGDALEKMSGQLQQVVEMLEEEGIASGQPSE